MVGALIEYLVNCSNPITHNRKGVDFMVDENKYKELKQKYIKIGGIAAVENKADFEKEELHVAYRETDKEIFFDRKHYGLYGCFTVMTQWTYGTKEDLLFVLGVMSTHKSDMQTNTHEFYKEITKTRENAYKLAEIDTLEEMKRIGKIEGIDVVAESENEACEKYFNNSNKFTENNYFYHFKIGRVLFRECEEIAKCEL